MSARWAARIPWHVVLLVLALGVTVRAAPTISPARIAVYRVTTGQWFIFDPILVLREVLWGCAGCGFHFPFPQDYNGDGADDVAVVTFVNGDDGDPEFPNASLVAQGSSGASLFCTTCVPVPHDYDGDGTSDFAVFDASAGQWRIAATSSSDGGEVSLPFGCPGCADIPVPGRFSALNPDSPKLFSTFSSTTGSHPTGITSGPDGTLWFTENQGNRIGRVTPDGLMTEFALPSPGSAPFGIASGPDGNLWFTESGGSRIGRITPAGALTEFALPGPGSNPSGITNGPDGNLWFTESDGDRIGRITPGGVITEFALPATGSGPSAIAGGSDGNLWFTETGGGRIGRITPGGTITEFAIPTAASAPTGIAAGPGGNLWFTESGSSRLGRITPAGEIVEFVLSPSPYVHLSGVTAGPDGQLWVKGFFRFFSARPFLLEYHDLVWRVDASGQILEKFTSAFSPFGIETGAIAAGPDGRIWFAQPHFDLVGCLSVTVPYTGIAVYRKATGEWFILEATGEVRVVAWGCPGCGDVPVPRDYDGDGIDDIAVFRPRTGEWFILRSSDGGLTHVSWGASSGDIPVPADYDGDAKADVAVYRTSTGEWFVLRTSDGGLTHAQWGCPLCGDVPVPARY